jgi:hypothetical protein
MAVISGLETNDQAKWANARACFPAVLKVVGDPMNAGTMVAMSKSSLTKEKTMIRRIAATLFMSAAFIGIPAFTGGCDREVSHEKTVTETPSGGTKVQEKTVTEKPDGTLEKKTEVKKTNP